MLTRLFIAGATGAIGPPLLLDAGYDVYALTRDPAKARDLEDRGVHAIVGDVFDPGYADATRARDVLGWDPTWRPRANEEETIKRQPIDT